MGGIRADCQPDKGLLICGHFLKEFANRLPILCLIWRIVEYKIRLA